MTSEFFIASWSGLMKVYHFASGERAALTYGCRIVRGQGYVIQRDENRVMILPIILPGGPLERI